MRRNRLSVRAVTPVGQNLPKDWEMKAYNFNQFVDKVKSNISLQNIGNMDEVPASFDMTSYYTVDVKGAKGITLKTTGNDKSNFTVVL